VNRGCFLGGIKIPVFFVGWKGLIIRRPGKIAASCWLQETAGAREGKTLVPQQVTKAIVIPITNKIRAL
jgi:hypothetical protein